ncbi:HNH endonuclease [Pseudoxanthomonas mexicana]
MELDVNFSELWRQARRVSENIVPFDWTASVVLDPIDIQLSEGKEVQLEDLDVVNGLLSVEGRQVLLFIPDQHAPVDVVQAFPEKGKRFHVADCKTLQDMRARGRFQRYLATNKLDGMFLITGADSAGRYREVESELRVCMNCLEVVNYRDYAHKSHGGERRSVWREFEIAEFFNTFSTSFRYLPRNIAARPGSGKYTDDWAQISSVIRSRCGFRCDDCGLDLSAHRNLLHVHHINGVKSDNSAGNLRPLCADCHRKQPFHERMFVNSTDMAIITRLRNAQRLVGNDWDAVLKLADLSVHGAISHARHRDFEPPEIGYEFAGKDQTVIAEAEAAWPARRIAICIAEKPSIPGWTMLSGAEFMQRY